MADRARVVFLGSDGIALPGLDWLASQPGIEVGGVFTQPDRPVGRGQEIRGNAIKAWAAARGIVVLQPARLGPAERDALAALRPDLALVMAYGHILKDEFIATPRCGTVNLHASILPKYRGASPIQTAIAAGETETGVALMRIVRELDAGPVAEVERVPIAPLDTALEVEGKLAAAVPRLLARTLDGILDGTLAFHPQEAARATFCRRLEKADGAIDFATPASELAATINGLYPWPGVQLAINGVVIKLGLADVADGPAPTHAGTVIGADALGLLVGTSHGVLRLRRLQRPGGKMLPAADFLRGFPILAGTRLPSRPMPHLASETPFKKKPAPER